MAKEPGEPIEEFDESVREDLPEDYILPELKKSFENASTETLEELVASRLVIVSLNEKEIAKMQAENFMLEEQLRAARAELKKRKEK